MARLAGKRALVTGGSRGIGAAICRHLAAEGASVAINYVASASRAQTLADELNHAAGIEAAFAVQADIQHEAAVDAMVRQVVEQFGGIDILINNAGYESTVSAIDLSVDEWDRVLNINLRGAFLCARTAARFMIAQRTGGVIINNSSIHDSIPRLGLAHYCASKGGLEMLMKTLALEWAEFNIRVLNVSPGAIETEMNREEIAAFGREKFD
ncbi:MAG: SDR family NAD(P)-dependent oxidoreductase, partial [Anaerolineae bacterium]|nr:SDR family NAD(P)-dependent oxidoreductase [Anaerolineae bacterium]